VDSRQPIAFTVLQNSIIRRASKPVQITPLILPQLPIRRKGLTEFTFSRYLCPWLCDFRGPSLFLDADILVLCDIWELMDYWDALYQIQVVKNPENFEWPSLMLFSNTRCRHLTPEFINDENNKVHKIWEWADCGELPSQYNHCVGYDKPRDDAKIVHFTQGIPCFEETQHSEYADAWEDEMRSALHTVPWKDLMGNSVHAKKVLARQVA
jgi:lipopolysaccharide biosynthesis glycosyltransferase